MEHSPVTRKRSERVSSVTAEPKNLAPRVRRHMSPGASVVRPRLDRERLREEGGLALEGEQHLVAGSELAASGAKCRHPVAEACRVRAIWQAPVILSPVPGRVFVWSLGVSRSGRLRWAASRRGRSSPRAHSGHRWQPRFWPPTEESRLSGLVESAPAHPKRSVVSQAAQPFCGPGS